MAIVTTICTIQWKQSCDYLPFYRAEIHAKAPIHNYLKINCNVNKNVYGSKLSIC